MILLILVFGTLFLTLYLEDINQITIFCWGVLSVFRVLVALSILYCWEDTLTVLCWGFSFSGGTVSDDRTRARPLLFIVFVFWFGESISQVMQVLIRSDSLQELLIQIILIIQFNIILLCL